MKRVLLVSALVRETSKRHVLLALTFMCIVYVAMSWSGIHLTALILTRSDYFLLAVVVFGSPALGYAINRAGFLNKRRQIPPHNQHD